MATFEATDRWVDHPYQSRVALIGDAAASNDPTWGEGLSLAARDVRVLRDALLTEADWDRAGHDYASEHDRYYGVLQTVSGWYAELIYARGGEADQRRERAFSEVARDPSRFPDHLISGPDLPVDDLMRVRFFAEVD